jgi:hypothetical protein
LDDLRVMRRLRDWAMGVVAAVAWLPPPSGFAHPHAVHSAPIAPPSLGSSLRIPSPRLAQSLPALQLPQSSQHVQLGRPCPLCGHGIPRFKLSPKLSLGADAAIDRLRIYVQIGGQRAAAGAAAGEGASTPTVHARPRGHDLELGLDVNLSSGLMSLGTRF